MASRVRARPVHRSHGFNAADYDDEDRSAPDYSAKADGLTIREYERILAKKESGAELTPEEEETFAAAHAAMRTVASAVSAATAGLLKSLIQPETRTSEQYEEEVRRHLSRYAEFLDESLLWSYVERNMGLLSLTLVNPTDHVYEDVQLKLYLPGQVKAMNDVPQPASSPPARPRPFGTGSPVLDFDLLGGRAPSWSAVIPRQAGYAPPRRPKIDNSGSVKVTYPPVLLRPRAHEALDSIVLIINESPGSVINGTWEASATNAEGRVNGHLTVRVAKAPLPVSDLLADVAPDHDYAAASLRGRAQILCASNAED